MRKVNSRQKGARGEREAADYLTRLGFPCERNARIGVPGADDLRCPSLPHVHIEVKRVQGMDLDTALLADAMDQAADAADGRRACVLWRPNGKRWRMSAITPDGNIVTAYGDAGITEMLAMLNQIDAEAVAETNLARSAP